MVVKQQAKDVLARIVLFVLGYLAVSCFSKHLDSHNDSFQDTTDMSREFAVRWREDGGDEIMEAMHSCGIAFDDIVFRSKSKTIFHGSQEQVQRLLAHDLVKSIRPITAANKILDTSSFAADEDGVVRVLLLLSNRRSGWDKERVIERIYRAMARQHPDHITALTLTPIAESKRKILCEFVPTDTAPSGMPYEVPVDVDDVLSVLSAEPAVHSVETMPRYGPSNYNSKWIIQGTPPDRSQMLTNTLGLSGEGQVVGVADSGLDHSLCFFSDPSEVVTVVTSRSSTDASATHRKLVQYWARADAGDDVNGHGTHVCGTLAGSGGGDYDGVAPGARIAFVDLALVGATSFGLPDLYGDLFPSYSDLGVNIQSHSWGSAGVQYTADTEEVDRWMWEHPEALILFAAGNNGAQGPRTVINPTTNKNGVCVGSSMNLPHLVSASQLVRALSSAQGPAADGRIKPDILAPGSGVTSAAGSGSGGSGECSVVEKSGSSMACPAVAGAALLVREYVQSGFYPSGAAVEADGWDPSGALVKAMLLGSGRVVYGTDPAPSNTQGFGRVSLDTVLRDPVSAFNLFLVDSGGEGGGGGGGGGGGESGALTHGSWQRHCFQVTADEEHPFKATLVWTDAPGDTQAELQLVNDLTLAVHSDGGGEGGGGLTVGNHRKGPAEFIARGPNIADTSIPFGHADFGRTLDIMPPMAAQMVLANPDSGCRIRSNSPDMAGKWALVDGTSSFCFVSVRANLMQQRGAVGMVIERSSYTAPWGSDPLNAGIHIPIITVRPEQATQIRALLATHPNLVFSLGVTEVTDADHLNTVEQVRLPGTTAGLVAVTVLAESVLRGPQPYALVVTGNFELSPSCPATAADCPMCVHGSCSAGVCECQPGWGGIACAHSLCGGDSSSDGAVCSGRGVCGAAGCECVAGYSGGLCEETECEGAVVLNGRSGELADHAGGGAYGPNKLCTWLLRPEGVVRQIRINVTALDTQLGEDTVAVLDGDGWANNMLAVLSGSQSDGGDVNGLGDSGGVFLSNGPVASVVFASGGGVQVGGGAGVTFTYEALACWQDCSGHGVCEESSGECVCEEGWVGLGCGQTCCSECGGRGDCVACECECEALSFGPACEAEHCSGVQLFRAPIGQLGSHAGAGVGGGGEYEANAFCGFLLRPEGASWISLSITELDMEDQWDWVYVFADEAQTELLASYTGGGASSSSSMPLDSSYDTPSLFLTFRSYRVGGGAGFQATYASDGDPLPLPPPADDDGDDDVVVVPPPPPPDTQPPAFSPSQAFTLSAVVPRRIRSDVVLAQPGQVTAVDAHDGGEVALTVVPPASAALFFVDGDGAVVGRKNVLSTRDSPYSFQLEGCDQAGNCAYADVEVVLTRR